MGGPAQQKPEIVWDSKTKRDVVNYIRDLGDDMRNFFSYAIEYVNNQKNEPKEQFWLNLFCPDRDHPKESILKETKDIRKKPCPENPYRNQDVQALWKFLYYGKNRDLPEEQEDSKYYFEFFKLPRAAKRSRRSQYENRLHDAIESRNQVMAHVTQEQESAVDWKRLNQTIEVYKELTQCMERNDTWRPPQVERVKEFWKRKDQEVLARFGSEPLSLEELGREIFSADEDHLSQEQLSALMRTARLLRLEERNGWIYEEPSREDLIERMTPYLLKGETRPEAAEEIREQQRQRRASLEEDRRQLEEQEAQLVQPLWAPVPEREAAPLRQGGMVLHLTDRLSEALLYSFRVLVDETVFLVPEGRELLGKLRDILTKRHAALSVDASVVRTIFRQFRSSVPYTALELAEMEPESRQEMQELRNEMHQSAKMAIKLLRDLREKSCLRVASSPTDSRYPYENITYLVRSNPKVRFLVLTLDRQLAEELAQVKGANGVAAKPNLDGSLLFYRATRTAYSEMLRPIPKEETAAEAEGKDPAQPEEKGEPAGTRAKNAGRPGSEKAARDEILPVQRLPIPGETIVAQTRDGIRENLRLGKFLNSGGEGSIYLTSREELVAKIYLPKHLTRQRLEKLQSMISANPEIEGLCWPSALLYNSLEEWIGFLMPKAEGKELATTVFFSGRGDRNIKEMGWSRRHLVTIAGNLASLFAEMHRKGILMGDINPRNFMVRPDCTVYFVDCDSYQFEDFSCPVFSPLFLPPEIHERMRSTPGSQSAHIIRTPENELYSIAVLLFEVLFLGKAPYESRNTNNDDVIQAIIDGNFPYPYKGNDEDEDEDEPVQRTSILAPVGTWRKIWSNLPHSVKTGFYNAFTKKDRLSASDWAKTMWDYRRMIEEGKSNDELRPSKFKVLSGQEGAKMVDLVCEQCGTAFNQAEDVIRSRQKRGEKTLCDTCRTQRRNFEERAKRVTCDRCGKEFRSNIAAWMDHEEEGKPLYCPDCAEETVVCSRCGQSYRERREKVERLRERRQEPLCPSCFQEVFTQATCSECGAVYSDRIETVERLKRVGTPLLCPKCRGRKNSGRAEK